MTKLNINIMCDGGLGNRLGSLFGGLYYAKINNRIPKIYWPQNNWCGCKFDDLFDVDIESTNISFNESIESNKNSIFVVHEFSQIKNIVPRERIATKPQISVIVVSKIDVPTGGSIFNFFKVIGIKTPENPAKIRVNKIETPKIAPRTKFP